MGIEESFRNVEVSEVQMALLLRRADRWMATIAHELRNPLGSVILLLDQLKAFCGNNPNATLNCTRARDGAEQMARIIGDALDLSRANRGTITIKRERVEISKVVEAALRNVEPLLTSKNHRVLLTIPSGRLELVSHRTRLEQVVTNLLANAAKYTQPGGQIELVIERTCGCVQLRVRDNGIGIPKESLQRVFELYWQTSSGDGLGIGLALVKALVELLGGTVRAYSDGPGRGSEFVVCLESDQADPDRPQLIHAPFADASGTLERSDQG